MRPELFAAIYHCNKGFALRLSAKAPFLHFPCRTQAGCRLLRSLGEAPAPAVAAAGDDAHVALAFGACAANLLGITDERARHDYAIEEKFEAGIVLQGWEVKSVRASRAQINLAHIYVRDGELFLCNAHMTPADQACTHVTLESNRTRKLLMHRREIMKLIGKTERAGYTLVPLDLHFTRGRVKVTVALARGMREYEKRADQSKKDWKREQERIMKKDAHGRHVLE